MAAITVLSLDLVLKTIKAGTTTQTQTSPRGYGLVQIDSDPYNPTFNIFKQAPFRD